MNAIRQSKQNENDRSNKIAEYDMHSVAITHSLRMHTRTEVVRVSEMVGAFRFDRFQPCHPLNLTLNVYYLHKYSMKCNSSVMFTIS